MERGLVDSVLEHTDGNPTLLPFSPQVDNVIRGRTVFAPDSMQLLEVQYSNILRRGFLSRFQPIASITVWNVNAEILRMTTHHSAKRVFWSRDSQHYALLTSDLTGQVFRAPDSPAE